MSSKVTNAGAFFAFVGKGLGPKAGVASAYASIIGYVTIQLAIYGFFGLVISLTAAGFGLSLPWWAWALIAWVVVTLLSLLSVDIGAKVLGVLLSVELLALIITAVAILVNGGPEPMDINASFNPALVFAGGFAGTAGIALAFAFASFIGFEATAIYGEESKDPKRDVPRATYWAIGIIAALFAVVSFAMVVGMGSSQLIDQVVERSSVLADPAAVLFSLAAEYVSPEIVTIMALLVVTSLFAGLLAFQNAAARYFFAMGRGGVMPSMLGETNKVGAPQNGALLTSIIAGAVIVLFAAAGLDPFLNLFSWMSGIAVIAVVAVEVLVSIAVIAYFNKAGGGTLWNSKIAPAASVVLMLAGLYLLMSRFNLLAGTSADGVDPSLPESAWALSGLGWFFVLLPFLAMIVGYVVAGTRKNKNDALVRDFAS
jgi:amino acid transporter